ncbi:MAG: pseudaminic acid synthase [Halobacteriovoraceae bacterium]|nr:pseudaminic acid synthase [Halobacteriovoraceae bacterium]
MREIKIANYTIGSQHPPFIIAEMSGNHNGSLERALELVDKAAECGANALKLQTYTADTITLDCNAKDFVITEKGNLWEGERLYNLYQKAYTPWEWHQPIFERCREKGLIYLSTPFDETAVDFLEELNVPVYKIASFENNHFPMIKKIARTGKPMIISTGMASLSELAEMVELIKNEGNDQIILLVCTSSYPAKIEDANLNTIPHLKNTLDVQVGLSDHTLGPIVPIASIALGATVIEKHFTLDRNDGGVDSSFSMEPVDLKNLVDQSLLTWKSLGHVFYGPTKSEEFSAKNRRSIYIAEDISQGEVFTEKNIRIVRPGYGLHPKYIQHFIGKKAVKSFKKGTPLNWEHLF